MSASRAHIFLGREQFTCPFEAVVGSSAKDFQSANAQQRKDFEATIAQLN
jgi:hypothetical protein